MTTQDEVSLLRILLLQVLSERECAGEGHCGMGRNNVFPRWCSVCRAKMWLEEDKRKFGVDFVRLKEPISYP